MNKSCYDVAGNHSVRGSNPHLQLIVVRGFSMTKPNHSPSMLPNLVNSTLELIRLVPTHVILIVADWVMSSWRTCWPITWKLPGKVNRGLPNVYRCCLLVLLSTVSNFSMPLCRTMYPARGRELLMSRTSLLGHLGLLGALLWLPDVKSVVRGM